MRTTLTRVFFLGISSTWISALIVTPAVATSQIKVVATGDSITDTYVLYYPITDSIKYFADTGYEVQFQNISTPGLNAQQYAGRTKHPWNSGLRNYAQEVADAHPDVIIFMLGTNDVFGGDKDWKAYQACIPEIFNYWKNGPKVIVSGILPQLYNKTNQLITERYNPFLQQQAENFGFIFYDVNAMLRSKPNWQSYYHTDGLHLNSSPGDTWLARTMCDAVKENLEPLPEPGTCSLFVLAAVCLLGYGWQLQRGRGY